jgi:3-deoxy-D-manno-octulosonic acid kinase
MRVADEQQIPTTRGGILYDASRFGKPHEGWFTREHWGARLTDAGGGRGGVSFIDSDDGEWVWRHYRRGGAIANVSKDRYVWLGASRTRSFAEWRLLAELRRLGLPAPAPVAARYVRSGLTYTADLMTDRLPASLTLAEAINLAPLPDEDWRAIGGTIARFHAHGVHHADLNAHNIMVGRERAIFVLDFDRGRIRKRGVWEGQVLARLRRSLDKIAAAGSAVRFSDEDWRQLMKGYAGQE